MNCFQVLVSISTCAATRRERVEWVAAGAGAGAGAGRRRKWGAPGPSSSATAPALDYGGGGDSGGDSGGGGGGPGRLMPGDVVWGLTKAGGLLRTITRPTLNPFLLLRAFIRAVTLNVSHAGSSDLASSAPKP